MLDLLLRVDIWLFILVSSLMDNINFSYLKEFRDQTKSIVEFRFAGRTAPEPSSVLAPGFLFLLLLYLSFLHGVAAARTNYSAYFFPVFSCIINCIWLFLICSAHHLLITLFFSLLDPSFPLFHLRSRFFSFFFFCLCVCVCVCLSFKIWRIGTFSFLLILLNTTKSVL